MKKNIKIILIVLVALCLFGLLGLFFYSTKKLSPPSSLGPLTQTSPIINGEVKNSNPVNQRELSFVVNEKTSVYDFMNKLKDEGKINFTEKNYTGMGKFIDSINGVSGNGSQNWIYYVNGEEAHVGVSNYKIKSGDVVSWKYEKANY